MKKMNMIAYKDNRMVNLDNVSRIIVNIEKDPITFMIKSRKIIFNLNYSVSIDENSMRQTADYINWFVKNDRELEDVLKYIESKMDSNFIKIGNSKSNYINLKNVSSIKTNYDRGKITFNYNYSMLLREDDGFVADYDCLFVDDMEDFEDYVKKIEEKCDSWLKPSDPRQSYINPTCISSIYIEDDKLKFVVNLNFNITQPQNHNKQTSAFVNYHFNDKMVYNEFKEYFECFSNK